jgi:CRISPR/Cas system CMR-associated protein Cmr5 small subunit
MQTNEQRIAAKAYELLYATNEVNKEYVRIIRWLPSMLTQAGCETTFEFLRDQIASRARDAQTISLLCSHITQILNIPVTTDNVVESIQTYLQQLSTDQYMHFVLRFFSVLSWLKRLAVVKVQ